MYDTLSQLPLPLPSPSLSYSSSLLCSHIKHHFYCTTNIRYHISVRSGRGRRGSSGRGRGDGRGHDRGHNTNHGANTELQKRSGRGRRCSSGRGRGGGRDHDHSYNTNHGANSELQQRITQLDREIANYLCAGTMTTNSDAPLLGLYYHLYLHPHQTPSYHQNEHDHATTLSPTQVQQLEDQYQYQ